jgi:hypothetical protein
LPGLWPTGGHPPNTKKLEEEKYVPPSKCTQEVNVFIVDNLQEVPLIENILKAMGEPLIKSLMGVNPYFSFIAI